MAVVLDLSFLLLFAYQDYTKEKKIQLNCFKKCFYITDSISRSQMVLSEFLANLGFQSSHQEEGTTCHLLVVTQNIYGCENRKMYF